MALLHSSLIDNQILAYFPVLKQLSFTLIHDTEGIPHKHSENRQTHVDLAARIKPTILKMWDKSGTYRVITSFLQLRPHLTNWSKHAETEASIALTKWI